MDGPPWDQRIARVLVKPLVRSPVTPNQVTAATLLIALAGAGLFIPGRADLADWGAGLFVLALFLAAWTGNSQADFTLDIHRCEVGGDHPDIRIIACTRNIESGRFIGENLAVAFTNRGLAYKKKGHVDKAIADFSEAIRLKSDFVFAFNNRGNAYYRKGQFDRAIKDYDKAILLKPDDGQVFANQGLTYEKKGEPTQALRDFKKAYALGYHHPLLLKKLDESGVFL